MLPHDVSAKVSIGGFMPVRVLRGNGCALTTSQATYMRVKAQLALVISTALVLCVIIGFVMFTLDRSHFASRTIEFQETQRAAVTQIAERIRWQFEKLDDALYNLS
jgi:hypothetical protein